MLKMIMSIIPIVIAVITLFFTIMIPNRIMWKQVFVELSCQYSSEEFGEALLSIIDFFYNDCDKNFDKIAFEYRKRYLNDIKYNDDAQKNHQKQITILHNQRRLLAQFYYNLDMCVKSSCISRRLLRSCYQKSEADILKILYFMNKAVEEIPEIYKDISTYDRLPGITKSTSQMNKRISHLYRKIK